MHKLLPASLVLSGSGLFLGAAGLFALRNDSQPWSFAAVVVGLVAVVAGMRAAVLMDPVEAVVVPLPSPEPRPQLSPGAAACSGGARPHVPGGPVPGAPAVGPPSGAVDPWRRRDRAALGTLRTICL
jgi:hypothetical protein